MADVPAPFDFETNTKKAVLDWTEEIERKRPTNYGGASERTSKSSGLSLHSFQNSYSRPEKSSRSLAGELAPPLTGITTSPGGKPVVQMHDSYLILETETGIAIVDQHALHERILYENLKERVNSGVLESQKLLVPIPVDLSPNERACVLENLEFFKTLGLLVEQFGGDTVLISGSPAILSKTPPTEILMSLIEPILESGKKLDKAELLEELLHSMACKAAVKAGDRINAASMARLIELAEQEANSHHCPHGRPSMLVFTCDELDKMFKRS
jgi:DNA mismatch repair protein MutL